MADTSHRNHRSHYFGGDTKARIEIIPMIDVMMFLLVFFVLIMTEMIQGSGIALQLPQSATAQSLKAIKVTIGVSATGALTLDGRAIQRADLQKALAGFAGRQHVDVVVAADKSVQYQAIIDIMDSARQAGIQSIGLATKS